MSFTTMLLGGGWERSEWPDYIEVMHDVGCRDTRTYVPERTCTMHRDEHGIWHCSSCEASDENDVGIISWCDSWPPSFCPNCGAKVVEG